MQANQGIEKRVSPTIVEHTERKRERQRERRKETEKEIRRLAADEKVELREMTF